MQIRLLKVKELAVVIGVIHVYGKDAVDDQRG